MKNLSEREAMFLKDINESALTVQLEKSLPDDLLKQFYDYWSEPNKSGTKMKWELEKTWDTKRRIQRWLNNQNKWHAGTDTPKTGTSAARIAVARGW